MSVGVKKGSVLRVNAVDPAKKKKRSVDDILKDIHETGKKMQTLKRELESSCCGHCKYNEGACYSNHCEHPSVKETMDMFERQIFKKDFYSVKSWCPKIKKSEA